ncbi:hypothetical protein D3C86_1582120 [compost metagenome]
MLRDFLRPHRADVGAENAFRAQSLDIHIIKANGCLHQRATSMHPGNQWRVDNDRMKGDDPVGPGQLFIRGPGCDLQAIALMFQTRDILPRVDIIHSLRIDHQNIHEHLLFP